MPNSFKDIIIIPNRNSANFDPNIAFRGGNATANTEIMLRVYPDANGTLSWEGSAGQLFSISNDLTGTIFSVNDISGIPSIEAYANGVVSLAQYSGNVGIGTTSPIGKLNVVGTANITGSLTVAGNITAGNLIASSLINGNSNIIVNANGNITMAASGSERLRITTTGNVGIGISAPNAVLDVNRGSRTGTHLAAPTFYVTGDMSTGQTGGASNNIEFRHINGTQGIGFGYNTIYQAGTNTNEILNLLSKGTSPLTLNAYPYATGNVGINTTNPIAKLHINAGAVPSANTALRIQAADYTSIELISDNATATNRNWRIAGVYNNYGTFEILSSTIAGGSPTTSRLAINSSGNVAIGSTTANMRLFVTENNPVRGILTALVNGSTSSWTGAQLQFVQSSLADWVIGQPAGVNAFSFWSGRNQGADGTEVVRITNTGNVGIGTTTPRGGLEVAASLRQVVFPYSVVIGQGGTGYGTIAYNADYRDATNNTSNVKYLVTDTISQLDFSARDFIFRNAPSGTANTIATLTEVMRITGGGNVGISTSTPRARLDVSGVTANSIQTILARFPGDNLFTLATLNGNTTTNVSGSETARFGVIYDTNFTSFSAGFSFIRGGGAVDGAMTMITNATERIRITSTGNVGIGTVTPQYELDVNSGTGNVFALSAGTNFNAGLWSGIHFGYSEAASTLYRKSAIVFERQDSAARGKIHLLNNGDNNSNSATLVDSKVTVQFDGNVGIGTTSPGSALHLNNASAAGDTPRLRFTNTTTGTGATDGSYVGISNNNELDIYNYESANVRIGTFDNVRVIINSTGNLGIAGAGFTISNPQATLDIGGQSANFIQAAFNRSPSNTNTRLSVINGNTAVDATGSELVRIGTLFSANASNIGAGIAFYRGATSTEGSLSLLTGTNRRLTVATTGNVGINTTNPVGTLNVVGTANVTGNLTVTGDAVFGDTSGGNISNVNYITANFYIGDGGLLSNISGASSGNSISAGNSSVRVDTSSNVRVTVTSVPNVGVFTSGGLVITGTLSATGNANTGNIGATNGVFTSVAGTLTTAAQPNITSVGTLTSANVANLTGSNGLFVQAGQTTQFNYSKFVNNLGGNSGLIILTLGSTYAAGSLWSVGANGVTLYSSANAPMAIGTELQQPLRIGANSQTQLQLYANGLIQANGIATFSSNVTISGNLAVSANAVFANGSGGSLTGANSVTANFFIGDGGLLSNISAVAGSQLVNGNSNVVVSANANITMSTTGSERVRILTTGNVGVNTTTPAQRFVVNGGIQTIGSATLSAAMAPGILSLETPNLRMYIGDGTGYTMAFSKRTGSVTTDLVTITDAGSGNMNVLGTVTCNNLVETSTIAVKNNVVPITNALDTVGQLLGVTYDRKDGSKRGEAGLIAEHVAQILPNLIGYDESGKPVGIHYTKLTAYLIEAVKELSDRIKRLENKK